MHYENVKKVSLCYATRKALSTSANQWELRLFMFSRFQVILWWCNPSNRDHKGKECIPAEDKNHTFAKQNHNAFTFTRNRDAETAGVSLTKQDSPFQHFSQDSCFSFVSFVKLLSLRSVMLPQPFCVHTFPRNVVAFHIHQSWNGPLDFKCLVLKACGEIQHSVPAFTYKHSSFWRAVEGESQTLSNSRKPNFPWKQLKICVPFEGAMYNKRLFRKAAKSDGFWLPSLGRA